MNKMISSVYILESDNKPVIHYKKEESSESNDDLLLRLTKSLQQFANGIEEDLSDFVIGDKKYFFATNKMSETKYVIEADAEVKRKDVYPILKKVQNLYINEFIGSLTMSQEQIDKAKEKIKDEIAEALMNSNMKIEDFLKTI